MKFLIKSSPDKEGDIKKEIKIAWFPHRIKGSDVIVWLEGYVRILEYKTARTKILKVKKLKWVVNSEAINC